MLNNSIVVLDTNVLSDLFEVSPDDYNFVVKCLNSKKEIIYLTDTIYHELSTLIGKPYSQQSPLKQKKQDFLQKLNNNIEDLVKKIRGFEKFEQNLVNKDNLDEIERKLKYGRDEITKLLDGVDFSDMADSSLSIINTNFVTEFIHELKNEARISPALSRGALDKVSYDVENFFKKTKRANSFPDSNKCGISKFNDYFIIEELKLLSKKLKKGVVFVTSDVKGNFQDENCIMDFKEETSYELVVKSPPEFYASVAEEFNISRKNIIELFLGDEKYNFLEELNSTEFDSLIVDYLNDDIDGIGEEIEWFHVELLDINLDFTFFDEKRAIYTIIAYVTAEKVFYEYWGKDDDTKEWITSPPNYKNYGGVVLFSVSREFEVVEKKFTTQDVQYMLLDTESLEVEINTWGDFESDMHK